MEGRRRKEDRKRQKMALSPAEGVEEAWWRGGKRRKSGKRTQKESFRRQTESTAEVHKINGTGSTMELLTLCWKL